MILKTFFKMIGFIYFGVALTLKSSCRYSSNTQNACVREVKLETLKYYYDNRKNTNNISSHFKVD